MLSMDPAEESHHMKAAILYENIKLYSLKVYHCVTLSMYPSAFSNEHFDLLHHKSLMEMTKFKERP